MIAVAVTIVFMYIEPKISSIRNTQDLIVSYENEINNVSQVNQDLEAKIKAIDNIAPRDAQALVRFIPNDIDEISVLKDLGTILQAQSIDIYDILYNGSNAEEVKDEDVPDEYGLVTEHYFSASFETSYQQLKSLLSQLETNDYLLQVSNLKISDSASGLVKVDISLTAFTLPKVTD